MFMKKIVVPGELVAEGNVRPQEGVYVYNHKIYSEYLGVSYLSESGVKVVPLNGKYAPRVGDVIIGRVVSNDAFTYLLDVNSFLKCVLSKRDLENVLEVNDVILLKVNDVNEIKDISVELISKLFKGTILEINPKKVARVIGKSQSMLLTIEKYTKTKVTVGANGYLYVIGENIKLVQETLEKIDEYSHVDNLTNKIEEFLQKVTN